MFWFVVIAVLTGGSWAVWVAWSHRYDWPRYRPWLIGAGGVFALMYPLLGVLLLLPNSLEWISVAALALLAVPAAMASYGVWVKQVDANRARKRDKALGLPVGRRRLSVGWVAVLWIIGFAAASLLASVIINAATSEGDSATSANGTAASATFSVILGVCMAGFAAHLFVRRRRIAAEDLARQRVALTPPSPEPRAAGSTDDGEVPGQ